MATDTDVHPRPRSRGIYLLPNLLTTCCLFSGFYAVVAAIDKHFDHAGMAVFAAMIFDTLDGRIARLTRTESLFGKEFDSLADMVSFGEAVVFLAKEGLGVRQARDAAIERVEDHRGEHRHARMIEVLVDGCDHRVEAREQAAGGEQVRQQVDALAALSRVVLGFGGHGRTLTGAILSAKMRNVPTP